MRTSPFHHAIAMPIPSRFPALRTIDDNGSISSRIEQLTYDDLSAGEVLIRSRYAGVNYKDGLAITGRAKIITSFPRIAGIEVVGQVDSAEGGPLRPGQDVMVHGFMTGIAFDGGFSAWVRAPAAHVMPLPQGLSPYEAAVLGVPGFTVGLALERFEALGLTPAAGVVAVSGASGAVGMLAIAILARAGYRVAAITRKRDQTDALLALGAHEIVDATTLDAAGKPLEKGRFAAAIDNVGGATLSWLLRSMLEEGRVASVGNAAGNAFSCNVLPFIMRRVQMFGIVANADWPTRHRVWARLASDWKPDFARLAPQVQTITLQALQDHALRQLDGATTGRVLVEFEKP